MSLRACRTPPSYGWLRGLRTNTLTRFGSYSLPTESGGKLGPSTATLIRSASAIPRTCSATSRGRCSRTPPTSSGSSLTFLSRLMGLPMGDFVIYFNGVTVRHSGIWMGGRVQSKWGTGHLWEHALHEVPLRYGDEVGFFLRGAG